MRILLVGVGRWGEKHLRVLGELGCEVWTAEVSPERRAFAVRAGVPATRSVAAMTSGSFRSASRLSSPITERTARLTSLRLVGGSP